MVKSDPADKANKEASEKGTITCMGCIRAISETAMRCYHCGRTTDRGRDYHKSKPGEELKVAKIQEDLLNYYVKNDWENFRKIAENIDASVFTTDFTGSKSDAVTGAGLLAYYMRYAEKKTNGPDVTFGPRTKKLAVIFPSQIAPEFEKWLNKWIKIERDRSYKNIAESYENVKKVNDERLAKFSIEDLESSRSVKSLADRFDSAELSDNIDQLKEGLDWAIKNNASEENMRSRYLNLYTHQKARRLQELRNKAYSDSSKKNDTSLERKLSGSPTYSEQEHLRYLQDISYMISEQSKYAPTEAYELSPILEDLSNFAKSMSGLRNELKTDVLRNKISEDLGRFIEYAQGNHPGNFNRIPPYDFLIDLTRQLPRTLSSDIDELVKNSDDKAKEEAQLYSDRVREISNKSRLLHEKVKYLKAVSEEADKLSQQEVDVLLEFARKPKLYGGFTSGLRTGIERKILKYRSKSGDEFAKVVSHLANLEKFYRARIEKEVHENEGKWSAKRPEYVLEKLWGAKSSAQPEIKESELGGNKVSANAGIRNAFVVGCSACSSEDFRDDKYKIELSQAGLSCANCHKPFEHLEEIIPKLNVKLGLTGEQKELSIKLELKTFYENLSSLLSANADKQKISLLFFGSHHTNETNEESDLDCILLAEGVQSSTKEETNANEDRIKERFNRLLNRPEKLTQKFKVVPFVKDMDVYRGKIKFEGGAPSDITVLDGWDGLASKVLKYSIAQTGIHVYGENDLVARFKAEFSDPIVDPVQGYELFVLATRDLAEGLFNQSHNKLAKAILRAVHAIHIMSERPILVTYEEIKERSESIFIREKSKDIKRKLVDKAYDVKVGKDKFNWGDEKELELIEALFDLGKKVAAKTATEYGILFDVEIKKNLKKHFERRAVSDKFRDLLTKATNNTFYKNMLSYYLDELITFLRGDFPELPPKDLAEKLKVTGKEEAHNLLDKAIKIYAKGKVYNTDEMGVKGEERPSISSQAMLARLSLIKGDFQTVIDTLSPLLEKMSLNDLLSSLKKEDKSLTYLVLESTDNNLLANMYRNLAEAYLKTDNKERAGDLMWRAIKANPIDPKNWLMLSYADSNSKENERNKYRANVVPKILDKIFEGNPDKIEVSSQDDSLDVFFDMLNPFLEEYLNGEIGNIKIVYQKLLQKDFEKGIALLNDDINNYRYENTYLKITQKSLDVFLCLLREQESLLATLDAQKEVAKRTFAPYVAVIHSYPKFKRKCNDAALRLQSWHKELYRDSRDMSSQLGSNAPAEEYLKIGDIGSAIEAQNKSENFEELLEDARNEKSRYIAEAMDNLQKYKSKISHLMVA